MIGQIDKKIEQAHELLRALSENIPALKWRVENVDLGEPCLKIMLFLRQKDKWFIIPFSSEHYEYALLKRTGEAIHKLLFHEQA